MKAIAIIPGTTTARLAERAEPTITAADEIKVRVLRVGICGTDREEAHGGRADAPAGAKELVIGHEMLGEVVGTGKAVRRVRSGDLAVFTVRRPCGRCLPCAMNRSDMCETGAYRERGIRGLDGYQAEYVVDREQYVVRVPPEIASIGVLTEPLSVVEKAIAESVRIQCARLPGALATPEWLHGRRCLVAGLGPIGLLAAMVLVLRGAEVYGLDIVDETTTRPRWLARLGGGYVDGRKVPAARIEDAIGPMDLLVEATGAPKLAFNLLDALGLNGAYVLTGIPGGHSAVQVPGADLIREMVLQNQVMIGSVNAAQGHFQMAVDDLLQAHLRWSGHVEQLISHRFRFTASAAIDALHEHPPDEIKAVIEWAGGEEEGRSAPRAPAERDRALHRT